MIVLVGFMGAGKTTVGRMLAARLGLPFIDTDSLVEGRAGLAVREIFASLGEREFRALEREESLTALHGEDAVIALGGGALADPALRSALEWHTPVYLAVTFSEAMRRVGGDAARPMLSLRDPKGLFDERGGLYGGVAKVTVDTTGKQPHDVVEEIIAAADLGESGEEGERRIVVQAPSRTYEVVIGWGISSTITRERVAPDAETAFVVSHPALASVATQVVKSLEQDGLRTVPLDIPDGETSKSLATVADLYARLAAHEAHRTDPIVAVGGGVVTDVAGFVAATYTRGMPLVNVPTTLLGQVDAAIGGKTGVNLPEGKNLVGSFYQPSLVLCDCELLRGLPAEELRSGLAEVVKYGFIADPDLLNVLEQRAQRIFDRDRDVLVEVVSRSAAIKASYVAADEHDRGIRSHLNYGHTFAHAIERMSSFGTVRHGEAVALGMMAAAYLAAELGRIDEELVAGHRRILETVGLPVTARLDPTELQEAWAHDKKHRHGTRYVLLAGLGKAESGVEADEGALRRAIERMAR